MARFRGRCALNPASGVGSIRSDSSALRFTQAVSSTTQGTTVLTSSVAVADTTLSGNALPLSTLCHQAECVSHTQFQAQSLQTVPNAFE
jgi:hypothetical protein